MTNPDSPVTSHSLDRDAQDSVATAAMLLAGGAYYLLARFGMALFAVQPANITLIWLPAGLALVMIHHWGRRALPIIFVASFAANFPGMATASLLNHIVHTSIAAGADALAGALTALALARRLPRGLSKATDLIPFGLWVCLLPTAATSLILTLNLAAGNYIPWAAGPEFFRMLLLADSLGILLIFQVYQGWKLSDRRTPEQWLFVLLGALAIAAILLIDFTLLPGTVFLITLATLALAFEVGLLGMALLSTTALLFVMIATTKGYGPFVAATAEESNFRVLTFVFSSALATLGVTLQSRALQATEKARSLWQEAAEHDALTDLPNRRAFMPRLRLEHERSTRNKLAYSVAMLDLDHFKRINDTYGHAAGDAVLKAVATTVLANCRGIDTPARVGGEEFAILLPETSSEDARIMLERIRVAVALLTLPIGTTDVSLTISIGVACSADAQSDCDTVLNLADQALYAAKRHGRNRVITHAQTTH
ncbi:MAG: sensor domain-containing diguanylate cyclase [Rhodocyclaceae bacterium]|nr:sensor domain-containing diguanylate cyclase [Rhodocyclaceae bacterium]